MKIGGFIRQSFIDYPGKISCVVFTSSCNFKCHYCHNPELVELSKNKSLGVYLPGEILEYIKIYRHLLEGVVITGGEPTLQEDLIDFIEVLKKNRLLVKIDTNGTNPLVLKKAISLKLIDYVAMDVKSLFDIESYSKVTGTGISHELLLKIKESVDIIKQSGIDYEFRMTIVKEKTTKNELLEMVKQVSPAKRICFQSFIPSEKLLNPSYKNYSSYQAKELDSIALQARKYADQIVVR